MKMFLPKNIFYLRLYQKHGRQIEDREDVNDKDMHREIMYAEEIQRQSDNKAEHFDNAKKFLDENNFLISAESPKTECLQKR